MLNMGERIKSLRIENKMTQEHLGNLLGVKKAAIQKYESSAIINLKLDTLEKLCDIFQVSPNYLIGWQIGTLTSNESEKRDIFIDILKNHFDPGAYHLLETYYNLNTAARQKIVEYANDLSQIPKYKKISDE